MWKVQFSFLGGAGDVSVPCKGWKKNLSPTTSSKMFSIKDEGKKSWRVDSSGWDDEKDSGWTHSIDPGPKCITNNQSKEKNSLYKYIFQIDYIDNIRIQNTWTIPCKRDHMYFSYCHIFPFLMKENETTQLWII